MGTKNNMVKEAITPPTAKKKIDTFNKTEKSQTLNKKQKHSASINLIKVDHWINQGLLKELIHKNIVNNKNKSRSISTTSLSGKLPKWKNSQKQILAITI